MELVRVYRISKPKESDWLTNTLILIQIKEQNAVNSFEKHSFKMISNNIYGKK